MNTDSYVVETFSLLCFCYFTKLQERVLQLLISKVSGQEFRETYCRLSINSDRPSLYDRFKYLVHSELNFELIFFINNDLDEVVAVSGVQKNPYDENELWVKHIGVDERFRNQGLSKNLLDAVFKHASENHQTLHFSSFSEDGSKYLSGTIENLGWQYPEVIKEIPQVFRL